jgi:hypothetical protein
MNAPLLFDMGLSAPAVLFAIYFFFPVVLLALFFFYRYFKHKERMALIATNKDISTGRPKKAPLLVAGSVFAAFGFAILVSVVIAGFFASEQVKFIFLITVPLFIGVALLACYFYLRKRGN